MVKKASTHWLSDAEQATWRHYVTVSTVVSRMLDRELKEQHELSSEDYGILAMLSEAPDHQLRFRELGAALRLPKPFLTYRFQRLEQQGLVERRECGTDGRGAFAAVTEAGFDAIEAAAPTHVAGVRRFIFDHLDDQEMHLLGELMAKISAGIDADVCPTTTATGAEECSDG